MGPASGEPLALKKGFAGFARILRLPAAKARLFFRTPFAYPLQRAGER
jgi:hypothetical protein